MADADDILAQYGPPTLGSEPRLPLPDVRPLEMRRAQAAQDALTWKLFPHAGPVAGVTTADILSQYGGSDGQ